MKYDGFETAAAQLADAVPKAVLGSSERLGHLVKLGLQTEGGELGRHVSYVHISLKHNFSEVVRRTSERKLNFGQLSSDLLSYEVGLLAVSCFVSS